MCFLKAEPLLNYSFGTCQHRKIFPNFHPPNLLGNKFPPIRGAPNRGPGCYIAEDKYGFAYNLSKIPTSKKGYTLGARTAMRFKPVSKDVTPYPGMYQTINVREQHKPNFAPFNALLPRFRTYSKDSYYPGPTTYNPEIKPPKRVRWPMKFGSPDWAQVPCLQKKTLRAEGHPMTCGKEEEQKSGRLTGPEQHPPHRARTPATWAASGLGL
ncbi:PIFO, partial [Cervus elaphus hippelaphus]